MRVKTLLLFLTPLLVSEAQAFTLPNQTSLKGYDCAVCANLSHESLSLNWPIDNILLEHATAKEQISRKYIVKTSLKQLQKGVAIHTQAPGAVIRISPANLNKKFKPDFLIKSATGPKQSLMAASSLFSKDTALKDTIFAENTLAVSQLKPELGAGKFVISTPATFQIKAADENSQYIIQIFDFNSTTTLGIETNKASYQYGDELIATIKLHDETLDCSIQTLETYMINSRGDSIPLKATALNANTYEIKYPLLIDKTMQGENWLLVAKATGLSDNWNISRQTHTSFSYVLPSAAIRELKRISTDSFDFSAKIEAATDSRYALQAVLFGSDDKGEVHSIQTVQAASWLSAGINDFKFSFDSQLKTNFKPPYYLGYLQLTDYGQQKPVYKFDSKIKLTELD